MSMKGLHITLIDDIVISERAASAGGHQSLDYIPGANLLGAVAAKCYQQINQANPDNAYSLFHSGEVRFGNALPLTKNRSIGYPMPLCWHQQKSGPGGIDHDTQCIIPGNIRNYQHKAEHFPEEMQAKQMRDAYVAFDGSSAKPQRSLRMKTAIEPNTARASEGQLFGYSSIAAGTTFYAEIQMDVSSELQAQITNALQGELRIGRARGSEYGRIQCHLTDALPKPHSETLLGATELNLWLIADMAIQDEYGNPTLCPTTAELGLPEGMLNLGKSFIRTRRYAPFNGKYGFRDLERAIITQGSILNFSLTKPLTEPDIRRIENGLGLYRQAGLGQVIANPSLLSTPQPMLSTAPTIQKEETTASGSVGHELIQWLNDKATTKESRKRDRATADRWAEELERLYEAARKLAGEAPGINIEPSASQWGRILTLSKTGQTGTDFETKLHNITKDWTTETLTEANKGEPERTTLGQWLNRKTKQHELTHDLNYILGIVARKTQTYIQKQEACA